MSDLLNVYNRLNVNFVRGDGAWVYDAQDRKYLDAYAGIAVTGLGHNYPAITKIIQQQASKLIHTSNLVEVPEQEALGTMLKDLSGMPKAQVFFNNSGAEAVETAIKLAHLYGHSKSISDPKIIVFEGAFHGRTMGTISAGSNAKSRAGFEPLLPGFVRVPFNDVAALEEALRLDKEIVAVLVEPIQGESGIRVPAADYLNKVRALCDQHQALMLVDEVQSGMGRTGKFFCYEHNKILPDAIMMAKGLANGLPIGACIIRSPYCDLFKPGSHGSTFGGNPLCCATAVVTLQEIAKNNFIQNAAKQGQKLIDGFKAVFKDNPHVKEVRGKGLFLGVELDCECRDILPIALKHGIVFNIANLNTLRFLPPLILDDAQTKQILELIPQIVNEFYSARA